MRARTEWTVRENRVTIERGNGDHQTYVQISPQIPLLVSMG